MDKANLSFREMGLPDAETALALYMDYYNTCEEGQWTADTAGRRDLLYPGGNRDCPRPPGPGPGFSASGGGGAPGAGAGRGGSGAEFGQR